METNNEMQALLLLFFIQINFSVTRERVR